METQSLVLNIIDESVDYTVPGAKDFIGSVRISLSDALRKGSVSGVYPVLDETNSQRGELTVRISIADGITYEADKRGPLLSSSNLQADVIRKLA